MAHDTLIHAFSQPLRTATGEVYTVAAYGQERSDGTWVGWLVFTSEAGRQLRTGRETTQPNRDDLVYWATGLESVYLEGAFARAS